MKDEHIIKDETERKAHAENMLNMIDSDLFNTERNDHDVIEDLVELIRYQNKCINDLQEQVNRHEEQLNSQ